MNSTQISKRSSLCKQPAAQPPDYQVNLTQLFRKKRGRTATKRYLMAKCSTNDITSPQAATEVDDKASSPFVTPTELSRNQDMEQSSNIFGSPQQIVRPKTSRVRKNKIISSGVSSLLHKKDAFANDSTIFIKLDKMHLISPC